MPTIELATLQAELGTLGGVQPDAGPFTLVTITGKFSQPAPSGLVAASGSFTFTLNQPMSNNGYTVQAVPLIVSLDANGELTVVLPSNKDTLTSPLGCCYSVTEEITDGQPSDYFITVPVTTDELVIDSLKPSAIPWC
jgi:hypothetical protein